MHGQNHIKKDFPCSLDVVTSRVTGCRYSNYV